MNEKNRREERRSGSIGTGVSQKDLQIKKNYRNFDNLEWGLNLYMKCNLGAIFSKASL